MTFIAWFETFLSEKKTPFAQWEITAEDGAIHIINNDVVIEHIKIASPAEQSQIKNILVKIDFQNGNVNHFFQHLAQGLVAQF